MLDQYDTLQVACDSSRLYPTNLIRTHAFCHALESYRKRLHESQKSLFESRSQYHLIELVEAHNGDDVFGSTKSKSVDDLKTYFQVNRKDPKCRHAFIEAESSRSPLDCSKEMLEYLLSFHQVSPSFLELVFAFGAGKQPEDFHYTSFRHESFLDQVNKRFAIFRLGRSGREIRQCYNLWSTEPSSGGSNPWSIRQTAVYHSFDVETGKAFWIDIKANDVIKSRIRAETGISGNLRARNMIDPSSCFSSTLKTHLIHFEWCRENWRHQLTSLEKRSSGILKRILNAPVELLELTTSENTSDTGLNGESGGFEPGMGQNTAGRILSRRTTGASMIPKTILLPDFAKWGGRSRHSKPQATSVQSTLRGSLPSTQNDSVDGSSQFRFSEPFPIDQLQDLSRIESTLQEISLVMKLNADVLLEIMEYYQRLIDDPYFPIEIKDGSSTAVSDFFQQIRIIINELKREQCRIDSLLQVVSNGKSMFESILQFRNIEINTLFATNAHHGSLRMESMTQEMHESTIKMEKMTNSMHKLAERTERETASMHIITLVTLIFLPGTFIATFLGSGLFQWDQDKPEAMPTWKPEFFALFAKVCFPFMGAIGLIWALEMFLEALRSAEMLDNCEPRLYLMAYSLHGIKYFTRAYSDSSGEFSHHDFGCWVKENQKIGLNGYGKEDFYVSEDALRVYWEVHRVRDVFSEAGIHRQTPPSPELIIQSYIRIFSILIYIATPDLPSLAYLSVFSASGRNDYNLPLAGDIFPNTEEGRKVQARFLESQFLFSPVVFSPQLHERELDSRHVLPLTFKRQLSGRPGSSTNSAITKLYKLEKASKLQTKEDLVVIKEYPKSEIEHSFKNELKAYMSFHYAGDEPYVSKYFLKYYGSFKQNNKGFIILEYADEGSLLEFFKSNQVPRTREELHGLFENLSDLLYGLRILHAKDLGKTNRQLRGVHQDLKPANIFVSRNENGGTYQYNFKIGDFGLTSFTPTEANEIKNRDNKGGIMYNAPEMTNYDDFSRSLDEGISHLVDIWSFSCVLFEAAVWAISDERGREEFRSLRCKENDQKPRHRDQGYGASFHNGERRLGAIGRRWNKYSNKGDFLMI
uniref:non-specific serine/threonine protein kinase n=2 Tax=Talaromyces marneffei PM1 TaxID=1077442 RepID=A0A093V886_TALMA